MTVIKSSWIRIYFPWSEQRPIAPLVIFRIIFGVLLFSGVSRFMLKGWVSSLYIEPDYYFGYLGFEWVKPLPDQWMYLPFVLLLISSLGIILGGFYRISATVFFLCFTYVELIDKSNYLNHYYFVSLMSFLMIFVPAHQHFSLDAFFKKVTTRNTAPYWTTFILKFQISLVYIFAGIAKLNSDWLFHAQPLKTWLQAHHHLPLVGSWMQQDWVAYAFSWTGCFYDLFIVFFLLYPKTRKVAYAVVVLFHLITWYLFPIGIFPWMMIFSTILFFSLEFHERTLQRISSLFSRKYAQKKNEIIPPKIQSISPILRSFLILFMLVQLAVPLRYLLYPTDLFWSEEGFRFSWRVMLMHKEGHATFYMRDPATGQEIEINNANFLTATQEDQMATQPDMILQYAQIIKEHYNGKTLHFGEQKFPIVAPSVHAKIYVSLNGRPSQLFVNKTNDLTSIPYNLYHRNWLEEFRP